MKWNLVTPILDILIQLLDTHTIQIKLKIYWQELINLKHLKLKYLLKFKIKLYQLNLSKLMLIFWLIFMMDIFHKWVQI
jgi:hypothetical protein